MRHFCLILVCSVAMVGCRIEQTPERFIDNQAARTEALIAAQTELRARIASLGPALRNGAAAVDDILAPLEEISVVGPEAGQRITNPAELLNLLTRISPDPPLTADHVDVFIAPGMALAWFNAGFTPEATVGSEPGFRISGVFTRRGGVWRLTQGHISRPVTMPAER